ncbi:MAG: phospholipase/carboxylesterase [Bacteroidetes bacterium]|nr:phospholipase/carboxylesterase [Bacteroidota bacterium]
MKQKNIIIPKTARYFTLGEVSGQTETIWFVCHGYGQLANYFIQNFHALDLTKNLVIAPEGLHRFYWEKFSGRVVASWMTKEDRNEDITDYVNYLDAVYTEVLSELKDKKVKINVLGFSQGTATVCRWLANGKSTADVLLLWAGAFPADLDFGLSKTIFDRLKTVMIVGDADEFITEEEVKKQQEFLDQHRVKYELIRFHGKHEIPEETLMKISLELEG